MATLSDSVHHEVSIHLPSSISSRIHMHLTIQASNILLYLTTSTPETSPPATLGSFVYALPAGQKDALPLSTPLYVREETLETATRLARILVKKTGRPVYVGNSMGFASTGRGGAVEEEMEAVRKVVETVVKLVKEAGEKQDDVESAVKDLKIEA